MAVEVEIPVKPHTFVDGTPAIGAEVNANFDKIIDESYTTIGHAFNGWFSSPATFEYHSANSIKTTSDVDLTSLLQEGDKITWEHGTTGGDRFGWISFIDYDDTVANRTYIEIIGDEVLDEAVVADSVGISRVANPYGWPFAMPTGARNQGLINGKIVPTVASNNLTVAIKTLSDNDPSASRPVGIWIGDELRWITEAKSVTRNAGANWYNSGSAELATKEIDYFVYIGRKTSDSSLEVGFARIPYARLGSDFVNNGEDERYIKFGDPASATTDWSEVVNIGRFAATISGSPSRNWSVPTFTNANLIQEPIYETRLVEWAPTYTGFSVNPVSNVFRYKIINSRIILYLRTATLGTSNANTFTLTTPMAAINYGSSPTYVGAVQAINNGATLTTFAAAVLNGGSNSIQMRINPASSTGWTASGSKGIGGGELTYEI
jgi:hypothetical protein